MSIVNSIDDPGRESLGLRARNQKVELEKALRDVPAQDRRVRSDLQIALSVVDKMLAADLEHLPQVKALQVSHWLENTKHFAETAPSRMAGAK